MDEQKVKSDLNSILYNEKGVAINSRLKENWLRNNGYAEHLDFIIKEISNTFKEQAEKFDLSTKIRIYISGNCYVPTCIVCGKDITNYSKFKKKHRKYCSMKCCQNDPIVKATMLEGQKGLNIEEMNKKRKATCMERYGVESYSQLEEQRKNVQVWISKYYRENPEALIIASEKRKLTNLKKYGHEYAVQSDIVKKKSGVIISNIRQNKTDEEKKERIEKYRKSRLGEEGYEKITNYELLYDLYCNNKYTISRMSHELNLSQQAITKALEDFGIDIERTRNYNRSVGEIELYEFILTRKPSAINSYKLSNSRKELDIFIPELNLGIEYNGCRYHSENFRSRNYHREKLDYFNSNGIKVIQLWEDDWQFRKENIAKYFDNLFSDKITANYQVMEISEDFYIEFIGESSISPVRELADIYFGLSVDDEMVSAFGLSFIENQDIILTYNKSKYYTIKFIIDFIKEEFNPTNLYTIANLELFDLYDNEFTDFGFELVDEIEPDFMFYNLFSKVRESKEMWADRINIQDEIESHEDEYGIIRCFDSGHAIYVI